VTDPRCGTVAGYRAHQRSETPTCRPCKDAQAAWQRSYEIRRYLNRGPLLVDSTGTGRRLRALAAIGWSYADVAPRLGVSGLNLHRIPAQKRVHRDMAAKVVALYDELSMTPGPSVRARQMAKWKGWPGPLCWDDENLDDPRALPTAGHALRRRDGVAYDDVAVELAVCGYPTRLRPAERAEAVRRLTQAGLSAAQIAQRLDTTTRSVTRWRGKAAS
jgi:hypothetical protein